MVMLSSYRPRWLEHWLLSAAAEEPVVIVTGARQVGKSTLLEHSLADWNYLSLDEFDILAQAERDPTPLLAGGKVILDEAQRAPKLLQAIKHVVDKSRRRCRFILSGSANVLLMNKVTESLAGRAVMCTLLPFTWGEYRGRKPYSTIDDLFKAAMPTMPSDTSTMHEDITNAIWRGWMPVVMLEKSGDAAVRWMEGYVTSYLERDLRQLSQIDSLPDFRRLMSAIALRSGQLLNQTEIGRDISMKQPTVHRYLNILESSMLFERLPAFAVNRSKRLIKSPKPYFSDSGLAAFLAGYAQKKPEGPFWGALVETATLHHIKAWCQNHIPRPSVFYWRTTVDNEVDFVIERGNDLVAIEVKAATRVAYAHAEALRIFMREYPETRAGAIVYLGSEIVQLDEKIFAIPLHILV